jgi:hypothetical protein
VSQTATQQFRVRSRGFLHSLLRVGRHFDCLKKSNLRM